MLWRIVAIVFFCFSCLNYSVAQSDTTRPSQNTVNDTLVKEPDPEQVFKPMFGLGIGNFTFVGDVGNNYSGFHSLVSRIGYELKITHPLTDYLDLGFYVIFGKISANERDGIRNLNFESRIRTGGAILSYNFLHLIPKKRNVEPYLFAGFESFEFLSKTDLYDKFGNRYYYWSDGSIRNLAENSSNAGEAIMIQRDYTYESDLREQNLDGFGKYRERSWSIPIGIGMQFLISERVRFKIGTSYHITFTDLVDNISAKSVDDRKGDSKNDKFLYSSFSLNYDLMKSGDKKEDLPLEIDELGDEDYLALDMTDLDNDGVRDFKDNCLNTPLGVPVDAKGCPFDKDNDYVFDYVDDELPTPKGNFVDERGVTLTDADLEMRYLKYMDSTGQYHGGFQKVNKEEIGGDFAIINGSGKEIKRQGLTYFLVLNTEKKQVSANELYKYLGQKDFKQVQSGDTVYYVLGNYASIKNALKDRDKLEQNGVKTEGIGQLNNQNNTSELLTIEQIKEKIEKEQQTPTTENPVLNNNDQVVFRVQIAAFDKKMSPKVFKHIPDLIYITGDDNITRYYSGSFTSLEKAAEHKIDMVGKGFPTSFIVAYKNGKRIALSEAGAHMVDETNTEEIITDSKDLEQTKVDKALVKFKVQIGSYKNDIPANVLDVYLQLGAIEMKRTDDGHTVYLVGSEDDLKAIEALKNKMQQMGLKDAAIVGEFKGSLIPLQEAKTLKQID